MQGTEERHPQTRAWDGQSTGGSLGDLRVKTRYPPPAPLPPSWEMQRLTLKTSPPRSALFAASWPGSMPCASPRRGDPPSCTTISTFPTPHIGSIARSILIVDDLPPAFGTSPSRQPCPASHSAHRSHRRHRLETIPQGTPPLHPQQPFIITLRAPASSEAPRSPSFIYALAPGLTSLQMSMCTCTSSSARPS